jgi:beta-1,4-mannosyl-glycoprotein beta-1,4-N-acetylglucosaminyltransferase
MLYPYAEYLKTWTVDTPDWPAHVNYPESKLGAIIVETRPSYWLPMVIRQVMGMLGPAWYLHAFLSVASERYLREMLGGSWQFEVHRVGTQLLGSRTEAYSELLTSPAFWSQFTQEKLLVFQADSLVTSTDASPWLFYDFIGAPCGGSMTHDQTNFLYQGGTSLRSKRAMLEVCKIKRAAGMPEDEYFTRALREIGGFHLPTHDMAARFCVESIYKAHPFGVHGTDKFYQDAWLAEKILAGIPPRDSAPAISSDAGIRSISTAVETTARHLEALRRLQPERAGEIDAVLTAAAAARRPRVIDCFTFFNELDLLEIRLNELDPVVDTFVLVESVRTFTGESKPSSFTEHKQRYARFLPKLRHIIVENAPDGPDPWARERFIRNEILQGIRDCALDDYILISDVDEIVNANTLARACRQGVEQTRFEQKFHYYYVNCLCDDPWLLGPYLTRRRLLGQPHEQRVEIRDSKAPIAKDGGWHFSHLGGAETIQRKVKTGSHSEYNTAPYTDLEHIKRCMEAPCDLFGRAQQFRFVPLDESYPQFLRDNLERFKHLVHLVHQGS